MRSTRTKAIVLRRTNYGEADRVLQLLTPEGRLDAIARGVRREKSKLAGGIELFAVSDVVIASGQGSLGVLTSARLETLFHNILEDYERLQFGYEVLKHVSRASNSLDEPDWFFILREALAALNDNLVDIRLAQTWFYLKYAQMMGNALNLLTDDTGAKLRGDTGYRYYTQDRSFQESATGEITSDHIKLLRLLASKPIMAVAQIGGIQPILDVCRETAQLHASI